MRIRVVREVAYEIEEGETGEGRERLQKQLQNSLPVGMAIDFGRGLVVTVEHKKGPTWETDGERVKLALREHAAGRPGKQEGE